VTTGALLVVGATSGAGKSTVVAALCRAWRRQGRDVVPFKAQNMSNHSAVTPDGGEIGRAQATQAAAAGVLPDRRMNPVLLKPSSDRRSHLVVLGEEVAVTDARSYGSTALDLKPVVLDALDSLRSDHRWLVAEGAGGAAEINLLDRDLVNLPLAHAAGIPAILVVDIDRGGAFASAYGSLALLPDHLRARVAGVVFNRFRGDPSLLDDGRRDFESRSGVPIIGVLPHLGGEPMLGLEDSLDLEAVTSLGADTPSDRPLRVAVIRLPRLANPSDFDPLRVEPDVELHWAVRPSDLDRADLVVIPGSRATVEDLAWLRSRGLDQALAACRADVVGICAGYQMMGRSIHDDVESARGAVPGLGLLDVETRFAAPKIVRRSTGTTSHGPVEGYQIRLGRPQARAGSWLELDDGPEGSADPTGRMRGTSLHGLFDSDEFRAGFLASVAERHGRHFTPSVLAYADVLDRHHDRLATWLGDHLDLDRLSETAETAAPPGEGPGWFN
jgi:adenosylcobyric acid synthase